MTKRLRIIIWVAIIAVIALSITAIMFAPVCLRYNEDCGLIEFRIQKGDSLNVIADLLVERGVIRSSLLFKAYAIAVGQGRNLKVGLYKISPMMGIRSLVGIFSQGLSENEDVVVTIPEGSNINDIDAIFAKSGLSQKGEFLKPDIISREGYLFPDTYRFLPGTDKEEIIKILEANFHKKVDGLINAWRSEQASNRTMRDEESGQRVVIASILEKEVKTLEDMRLVAGIIEKRISLAMPLQVDATVAYGECLLKFQISQNCEIKEVNLIEGIKRAEPYNTYKYKGLPPGPIANPGLVAIQAVLNPAVSNYLYYLTDKDGNVHYARTLTEHQRNRAKYLNK